MTKADLVVAVAKGTGLTNAAAGKAVEAIITAVGSALKKGDSITLAGFGSFVVSSRKARTGRNPLSGKEINIEATQVPKFLPSKVLKSEINHFRLCKKMCVTTHGSDKGE